VQIDYSIDRQTGLIVFTPHGEFCLDDYIATWKGVFANRDFHKGMNTLWNLGSGSMKGLDWKNMHALLHHSMEISEQRGAGNTALVAPADFEYGMSRMLQIIAEGSSPNDMKVFRTMDKALTWLGVHSEAELD